MRIGKGKKSGRQAENRPEIFGISDDMNTAPSRKVTFAENAIVTVKILAGFGLLGAALWGVDVWILAR